MCIWFFTLLWSGGKLELKIAENFVLERRHPADKVFDGLEQWHLINSLQLLSYDDSQNIVSIALMGTSSTAATGPDGAGAATTQVTAGVGVAASEASESGLYDCG